MLWQMDSCMDTCQRRWPPTQPAQSTAERALWTWIHSSRKVLGQGTAATEPDAPLPQ